MPKILIPVVLLVTCLACGKDASSPLSPSTPTPTPTPSQTIVALAGTVSASSGARLGNATVTILDSVNIGRAAITNGNGDYRLDTLTIGNANLSAVADGYQEARRGVYINGANTLSFTLSPVPAPPFAISGSGDTVFDIPRTVTRIRIQGRYTGYSSNFIVYIASRLIVNELLGTGWGPTTFDGTYVTSGGVVEIKSSSGVAWTFTEVR